MELIRNWIITIMSVIIFVTFVEIIIPNGKSKKYINVVVGLLIIVVILNPLVHIFREGINFSDSVVQASNNLEYITTKSRVENIQFSQNALVLEIYKNNLEEQIKNRIERSTQYKVRAVNLDIDEGKDNFGLIKGVEVFLETKSIPSQSTTIEPVKIDVSINKNNSVKAQTIENTESKQIKSDLSSFYNIGEDSIKIYIQHKKTSEED